MLLCFSLTVKTCYRVLKNQNMETFLHILKMKLSSESSRSINRRCVPSKNICLQNPNPRLVSQAGKVEIQHLVQCREITQQKFKAYLTHFVLHDP